MFIQVRTQPQGEQEGTEIKINLGQVCWIDGNQLIMGNGLTIGVDEDSQKEIELAIAPKGKQSKNNEADKELLVLFEQLHTLTGGKGKPVFSLQREKKLKDLLTKHRMTKQDLIKAATNIGKDEFLQGDNENKKRYGDVDYLLRPDKAAKWADEAEKKKKGLF